MPFHAWLALVAAAFLLPGRAGADALRIDPRLAEAARLDAGALLPVWVEFTDKGEAGPADLAERLAAAEAALTPRARARRERAHVWPLVDYLDLPLHEPYIAALRAEGLVPYGASRWFNRVAVRVRGARLSRLADLPGVRWLAPVEKGTVTRDPVDLVPLGPPRRDAGAAPTRIDCPRGADCAQPSLSPNYGQTQQEMALFNIAALHDSGYTGSGILICVLDDGFPYYKAHECLAPQVIAPGFTRDFVWGVPNLPDSNYSSSNSVGHGTKTFSCIGGRKPGIYMGAAFDAQFALGRTEMDSAERRVEMTNWTMGAEWADSLGADIISSSLGYNIFDSPDPPYVYADMNGHTTVVTRAAQIAAFKGILVVNAAGNEGGNSWHKIIAPADADGDSMIAVGAVDALGTRIYFSSMGPTADGRIKPDLMAMGVGNPLPRITTPLDPTAYTTGSGTSFATPLVAGLAACMMQARPRLTPVQIIQSLRASADRYLHPDTLYGYGIPNGAKAMTITASTVSVPSTPVTIALAGPNPLHRGGRTTLRFAAGSGLPAGAKARVRVFDALGRVVRELWCADHLPAGHWITTTWDGRDARGDFAASGVYFAAIEAGRQAQSVRLVFLK